MKTVAVVVAGVAAILLATTGCAPTAPPKQAGMQVQTPTKTAIPFGAGNNSSGQTTGSGAGGFGETLHGSKDIDVTLTYQGFQDPGPNAYPSSDPAPVFEVAVVNGSDQTVGQDLIKTQVSYGGDVVTDAEVVCGDTKAFSCDANSPLKPGQSTAVTVGYAIPKNTDVRVSVQVYFDDTPDSVDFTFEGTIQ
ncbi:hypothetical protein GCM10009700_35170 [Brevibacterium sanguinis]|uniref:hypothetical protein n=1 Tax=Brevibacterium sanguinis TaxID=232444 RepID=UPI0031DEB191